MNKYIEYEQNTGINQSKLKILNKSLAEYKKMLAKIEARKLLYSGQNHFALGTGVDMMLTEGQAEFDKFFHISDGTKNPSDKVINVLRYAKEQIALIDDPIIKNEDNPELLFMYTGCKKVWEEACKKFDYYNNRPLLDSKLKELKKSNIYWKMMFESDGKHILDLNSLNTINTVVASFKKSKQYQRLIKPEKGKIILQQYPIYFTWNGVECKALLDLVIVDTVNKKVHIFDIKTTGLPLIEFNDAVIRWGYDFQCGFYTKAVLLHMPTKINNLTGWSKPSFSFIVESTVDPYKPVFINANDIIKESIAKAELAVEKYKWYKETNFKVDYETHKLLESDEVTLGFNDDEIVMAYG